MTDDPPRRRWFARSPNDSIMVEAGDVKLRVGKATQRRVWGLLVGPLLKWIGGLLAVVAGAGLWRC